MPNRQFFPRGITVRGPIIIDGRGSIATSSGLTAVGDVTITGGGVDLPLTSSASTGTDLVPYGNHVMITSSDGGVYLLDAPAVVGREVTFARTNTTASTSYLIPDTTSVLIWTSSGSSGGRQCAMNGLAAITLLALTTAQWVAIAKHGNAVLSSST